MTGTAVVVPCFNAGRTIGDAIESVRSQYQPVAECVVVDDGSDDPLTRRVLADIRRAGVFVVRTTNRGAAAARNFGISLTTSPYVVFLDADDVLDESYVEKLAGTLDQAPDIDFVTTGVRAFGGADYVWIPPACEWTTTLARGGPHVSSMFRRGLWADTGGFDESLEGYEDQDWWLTAIERGHRGAVVKEPLLQYRVRPGSRYDRAILPGPYRRTMAAINRKHRGASDADRLALVVEKELFRAELHRHGAALRGRRAMLESQARDIATTLEEKRASIVIHGLPLIDWAGVLNRTEPAAGTPLDACYREAFLRARPGDMGGAVLTLDAAADALASCTPESVDCIVMMESLNAAPDFRPLLAKVFQALKPGGVFLCAANCLGPVDDDRGRSGGRRFTPAALRAALSEFWPPEQVDVTSFGNLQTCVAFLAGATADSIDPETLARTDQWFPLVGCARAVKPGSSDNAPAGHSRGTPGTTGSAVVLLYHRVGDGASDPYDLQVGLEDFHRQLRHVKDAYRLATLEEIVSGLRSGALPDRAVAVTFDDGYLQHLEVVLPILEALEVPATFFVNTEGFASAHENWWDTVERVMSGSQAPAALDLYGDGRVTAATGTSEERAEALRVLTEHLYGLPLAAREAALSALARWSGQTLRPRDSHRALMADELRRLASSSLVSVAAHTVHHLSLPHQASHDQWTEISMSKCEIERVIGRPVGGFSYPYGEADRGSVDFARSAGFSYGVTVEPRAIGPGANALLLPRSEVKGRDSSRFDELLAARFRPA